MISLVVSPHYIYIFFFFTVISYDIWKYKIFLSACLERGQEINEDRRILGYAGDDII